jgi:hypothetical protein
VSGHKPLSQKQLDNLVEENKDDVKRIPQNPTFFWEEEDVYVARQPGRKSISLVQLRIRRRGKDEPTAAILRVGYGVIFKPEYVGTGGPFVAIISEITV